MLTAIIITSVIFMALIICLLMASKEWDILGAEYEVELQNRKAAVNPREITFLLHGEQRQSNQAFEGVDRRVG